MNLDTWDRELLHDVDRDFILDGLKHGFYITDATIDTHGENIFVENSTSATKPDVRHLVEQEILLELSHGRYVFTDTPPIITSALCTAEKSSGGIRLIHDLSRPEDESLNSFASKNTFTAESVSDAISRIGPRWFMGKIDLQSAYRSVPVHPSQYAFTGLHWIFENHKKHYMYDSRLPFGARKSPYIFHTLTQAVKRMMVRRGFTATTVFLDDFFVAGETFEECLIAYNTLIKLLCSLGFMINWTKVCDPTQRLVFLGVVIDTVHGTLSLEQTKVKRLQNDLTGIQARKRVTRRQLESLAGKLSWAAHVIPWGRTHLRSIFNVIKTLNLPKHKVLTSVITTDLQWWSVWLSMGNNTKLIWDNRPLLHAYTDASLRAGGGFYQGDWFYSEWQADWPDISDDHINIKELGSVCIAALRWGPTWSGHRVMIHTDSRVVEAMINNGSSTNDTCLAILKALSFISLFYGFTICADYIRGCDNIIADHISRMYMHEHFQKLFTIFYYVLGFRDALLPIYNLHTHMTPYSMSFLQNKLHVCATN